MLAGEGCRGGLVAENRKKKKKKKEEERGNIES
jgi:hypothetical protein